MDGPSWDSWPRARPPKSTKKILAAAPSNTRHSKCDSPISIYPASGHPTSLCEIESASGSDCAATLQIAGGNLHAEYGVVAAQPHAEVDVVGGEGEGEGDKASGTPKGGGATPKAKPAASAKSKAKAKAIKCR